MPHAIPPPTSPPSDRHPPACVAQGESAETLRETRQHAQDLLAKLKKESAYARALVLRYMELENEHESLFPALASAFKLTREEARRAAASPLHGHCMHSTPRRRSPRTGATHHRGAAAPRGSQLVLGTHHERGAARGLGA